MNDKPVTLQGHTIDEWKQAAKQWQHAFIQYADHSPTCKSRLDPHERHNTLDDRAVCSSHPCTCGLVSILSEACGVPYVVEDTDVTTGKPRFTLISTTTSTPEY